MSSDRQTLIPFWVGFGLRSADITAIWFRHVGVAAYLIERWQGAADGDEHRSPLPTTADGDAIDQRRPLVPYFTILAFVGGEGGLGAPA